MSRLPGPSQWTTIRRLFPMTRREFNTIVVELSARYGNLFEFSVPWRRSIALFEMNARYGNLFAFSVPWRRYVVVNEPALIKDILVTQQQSFTKSRGGRALSYLLGDGLLTSEDPLHRQMRRIVQPAFHRERIARYGAMMLAAADDFVDSLQPGIPFDLHAAMTALTLRITTTTLFGSDESASAQRISDALLLLNTQRQRMFAPLHYLRQRLPLPSKRMHQVRAELDAIVYGIIARRRADARDTGDALSMLLAAKDADTGYRLSDEQIRDEVMTLFVAAHETSANLLTWMLYLLAQHPQIDARVGAAAAVGDTAYAKAVVNESLRLYPPAWLIGRQSACEVTLSDGTVVAPETTLLISPLLLHRRADLFPDPLRFDPDRWLNWAPPAFAFLPFGGGMRRCIGDEFALHAAQIVVTAIVRKYSLAKEPAHEVSTSPLVTLQPSGPVLLHAFARTDVVSKESSALRPGGGEGA